jgi:ABC-2 type transport system ATP-binding protein
LGIAAALLGDPATVVLDEPVNGLDPEGVLWVRNLLKRLAAEGRTVFVSSHLMSEMALTAEHLIVIGRGRLIADTSVKEFVASASQDVVRVVTPQPTELRAALDRAEVSVGDDGALIVRGMSNKDIGEIALRNGIALYELTPQLASLEDAFMELTRDDVEFKALAGVGGGEHE